ncbi:MAG: hypothetical protein LBI70_02220 [Rickettsiales bacterium]|jgi:hypothetical protein|nr:hypothetical protein [Rickettsiales bacterium]
MKIIDNLSDFIEKIELARKTNNLDVSADEDLSIAIMNLISIEEHLFFSGAKTQDNHFYDLIEEIRECRKELLGKIIKSYGGEVWCISKHLLAGCMRLMETGTKLLHSEKKEEAYDFFGKAYNLYCLFWGLNLNVFEAETTEELVGLVDRDTADSIAGGSEIAPDQPVAEGEHGFVQNSYPEKEKKEKKEKRGFGKMLKDFVAKAINCCRE